MNIHDHCMRFDNYTRKWLFLQLLRNVATNVAFYILKTAVSLFLNSLYKWSHWLEQNCFR